MPQNPIAEKQISSASAAAPNLLAVEASPPGRTLYVAIDLGVEDRPAKTAIFIPAGFDVSLGMDIVLYLPGFNIPDGVVTIDQYLKKDYGALREGLNASGRNVVLVAPTLGPQSQAGDLIEPGGLDKLLQQALISVLTHGGLSAPPDTLTLRNLIISCHSGGGSPQRKIVGGDDGALGNLRECWGFDSLNNTPDVPFWSGWVRDQTDDRLLLFYLPNGTPVAQRCEQLAAQKIPNLIARKSDAADHMHVPVTHWVTCLKGATFLDFRPGIIAPEDQPVT